MPTATTTQTTLWTMPWSVWVCTNTPTARNTTSAKMGSSSAFGWVRVSTTTDSPSFSRFFEIATDGSCHRSTANVDDITGAHRSGFAAALHDEPTEPVDAGGGPRQHLARGQVDPDVLPDRRARCGVRRREARGRFVATLQPRDVPLPQRVEEEAEQLGPVRRLPLERQ